MILALDGSTNFASVALLRDGRLVAGKSVEVPRGRGGALFSALQEILKDAPEIRRVVVGIGPGSYNGIRSSMAVAWGIAASLGIPVTGISSLLGMEEGNYCAAGDARREQFYFAEVAAGRFVRAPELFSRDGLLREVDNRPGCHVCVPSALDFLPQALIRAPDAATLGRLGANENCVWGAMPEPIYLKPAHITLPAKNRINSIRDDRAPRPEAS